MASRAHTPSAALATHVLLMEVASERYDAILRETTADLRRLAGKLSGLLQVDLYGTDDHTYILVVSEWVDNIAWGKAQWDDDVQNMAVARFSAARRVHSKLYRRIVL
jgi:hypothetical protein